MPKEIAVVDSNIHFLEQGIRLLDTISDEAYSKNNGPFNKSGVGRHFRHIIEHYYSFLSPRESLIDYDARERDLRLETDRSYMISELKRVTSSLTEYKNNPESLDRIIKVRSNEGIGQENSPLSSSSLRRELQFLISHTVHHYALIGLILKTMDFDIDPEFGVAPSTLKYDKGRESDAQAS